MNVDNMPNIARLKYVYREEIESIAPPLEGKVLESEIILASGVEWRSIEFVLKSATSNLSVDDTAGGKVYKYQAKYRLAKDNKDTNKLLAEMSNRFMLLLETDCNNITRLIGNENAFARLTYDVNKTGTLNAYDCVLTCTSL